MSNASRTGLSTLTLLVSALALVAAGTGVLWTGHCVGATLHNLYGEPITLKGAGLYRNDSISAAAQVIAQDVITLALGIPLLLVSPWRFRKGTLRGQLLLTGTLAYLLYTYASNGVAVSAQELVMFPALTVGGIAMLALLLRAVRTPAE
jgi:hypothetical protein